MPYLEFLALLLADDDFGRQLAELGDEVVHANHSDVLGGYLRLANQECFCLSETGYLRCQPDAAVAPLPQYLWRWRWLMAWLDRWDVERL